MAAQCTTRSAAPSPRAELGGPPARLVRSSAVPLAFHHVAIQCADLDRCERFYREVLGLSVLRRWPREDGAGDRSVWLSVGDGGEEFVALERADEPAQLRPWRDGKAGLHLLALRIAPSERRGWEDRLEAAGVLVVHRTRWSIYFHDPEGNRIGLTHHPHDA
jgi:glyoxylase I family protein